jgi:hypothetical protein
VRLLAGRADRLGLVRVIIAASAIVRVQHANGDDFAVFQDVRIFGAGEVDRRWSVPGVGVGMDLHGEGVRPAPPTRASPQPTRRRVTKRRMRPSAAGAISSTRSTCSALRIWRWSGVSSVRQETVPSEMASGDEVHRPCVYRPPRGTRCDPRGSGRRSATRRDDSSRQRRSCPRIAISKSAGRARTVAVVDPPPHASSRCDWPRLRHRAGVSQPNDLRTASPQPGRATSHDWINSAECGTPV